MTDPTDGTMTLEEYGKTLWASNNPDSSFEAYGWFQFNSVRESLNKDLTVEEALKNLGIEKDIVLDKEMLSYETINEETCETVISDTINKFRKWELTYPEVFHVYDDDPNDNNSRPITLAQYEIYFTAFNEQ